MCIFSVFLFELAFLYTSALNSETVNVDTAYRIASLNYPSESYDLVTSDGYVLRIFRIPFSPKLQNSSKRRPVVLLIHGILSSSDCWILNGPEDAIAFLLADAGYDVWLGNCRGNTYSRMNVNISPNMSSFWDFSWNEVGLYDLPNMIDFILNHTNETKLHYIGHSEGTTIFFVLMSENPKYNSKIKTAHMLAPASFMKPSDSLIFKTLGPLFGYPSLLSSLTVGHEFLPNMGILNNETCSISFIQPFCADILFFLGGWDSKNLNYALLPDIFETHPAGTSTGSVMHYFQEYNSGFFRKFDFGSEGNNLKYGQSSPPNYNLKNIISPVSLYYGDNDYLVSVESVQKLETFLPTLAESFHVPIPEWNHFDFLWAKNVKDVLYNRIMTGMDDFEKKNNKT